MKKALILGILCLFSFSLFAQKDTTKKVSSDTAKKAIAKKVSKSQKSVELFGFGKPTPNGYSQGRVTFFQEDKNIFIDGQLEIGGLGGNDGIGVVVGVPIRTLGKILKIMPGFGVVVNHGYSLVFELRTESKAGPLTLSNNFQINDGKRLFSELNLVVLPKIFIGCYAQIMSFHLLSVPAPGLNDVNDKAYSAELGPIIRISLKKFNITLGDLFGHAYEELFIEPTQLGQKGYTLRTNHPRTHRGMIKVAIDF